MFLGRVRALVEQAAAPPRAPVQETTARGAATSPAVIVAAGNILCYKNTESTPDDHCRFLVQSEQETSYCYRKCEMVASQHSKIPKTMLSANSHRITSLHLWRIQAKGTM